MQQIVKFTKISPINPKRAGGACGFLEMLVFVVVFLIDFGVVFVVVIGVVFVIVVVVAILVVVICQSLEKWQTMAQNDRRTE